MIDTFEHWVEHIFSHPVAEPAWYWNYEADTSEPSPIKTVEYLTLLFADPIQVLSGYSDAQLKQGFWYLIDNSCSDHAFSLLDPIVPWEKRRDCIRMILCVFEELFVQRCSPHLSHLNEVGSNPLNSICYMWWDIIPIFGQPESPERRETDAECLAVMGRILSLESIACQESALHGHGHWALYYPDHVQNVIGNWLETHDTIRIELRRYAEAAQEGYVN